MTWNQNGLRLKLLVFALSVLWDMVWGAAAGSWGLWPTTCCWRYFQCEERLFFPSESGCQGISGSLCKYESTRIYQEHWKENVSPQHVQCVLAPLQSDPSQAPPAVLLLPEPSRTCQSCSCRGQPCSLLQSPAASVRCWQKAVESFTSHAELGEFSLIFDSDPVDGVRWETTASAAGPTQVL